jgi:ABC-type multidrug transport system permease subunit
MREVFFNHNSGIFWRAFEFKIKTGMFDGHLEYFTAIWYIFYSFGMFFLFWYVASRKIWQP